MAKNIEHLLKNLQSVRLSPEARLRMREELFSYAALHAISDMPIRARTGVFSFGFRAYAALATFVLIVGGAGGTAFAAEGTLPGDILYSVKTHVSEPIQTALISDTKERATWHAILAERRLEEAATLASKNKLTAKTQKVLATNLSTHVEASAQNADELQESGDVIASLDARSDLEARLTAHEQILSIMASHFAEASSTDDSDTSIAVKKLLALVESHKTSVESTRLALQNEISPSSTHTMVAAKSTTAVSGDDLVEASTTIMVAKVDDSSSADTFSVAAMQVANSDIERNEEVKTILAKHAMLLAAFMPIATTTDQIGSTTAPSAATTTATTTVQVDSEDED